MSSRVTDKDRGWKRAMRAMRPDNAHVVVGVPDDPKKGSEGVTLAQVAAVHEFGTDTIPRRSFIADTADENRRRYAKFLASHEVSVLTGRQTRRGALNLLGLVMVGDVKRRISAGIAPPLKPETIRRKGSSTPLIDTGQLRNSIMHEVRGA